MFPYHILASALRITLVARCSVSHNDVSHKVIRLVLIAIYKMLTDIKAFVFVFFCELLVNIFCTK